VFAAETRGYDNGQERREKDRRFRGKEADAESMDAEEFKVMDNSKSHSLQEIYQKEYGRRESFLWKQK
jgi:hypothetical protein